jgi:L-galactono-1,4-lactone dehydrogenase
LCRRVYEPETEEEVTRLMRMAIGEGWSLRVVGSGISPNGMGFSSKCMINMALMNKVLHVDVDKKQVCHFLVQKHMRFLDCFQGR